MSTNKQDLSLDELLKIYREGRAVKDKAAGIIEQEISGKGHAIGYTRVSTLIQAKDGASMETQKKAIEDYCKNKNLILDDVVDEPAKSGADRSRPKLKEMIDILLPGMKVVCYAIDRMCRDTKYLLDIKEMIHSKGCSIYFIDRSLDTSDTSTELLLTIMAAVAAETRKATNRNISAVMKDMSQKKVLRTRPKYGWKVVNKENVIDEDEQAVIGIIHYMIKDNPDITLAEIGRRLEIMQVKIRKCAKIYPTTIKNIIETNRLYQK